MFLLIVFFFRGDLMNAARFVPNRCVGSVRFYRLQRTFSRLFAKTPKVGKSRCPLITSGQVCSDLTYRDVAASLSDHRRLF